ncbi:MAG: hypothetical protein WCQ99_02070 [Pseudomonadota bacterium]
MRKVIQLEAPKHFGDCPKCKKNDGHLNVGREHWFVCKKHRVKWKAGHDMFPDWKKETVHTWKQNEALLEHFMKIEPFYAGKFIEEDIFYFQPMRKEKFFPLKLVEKSSSILCPQAAER